LAEWLIDTGIGESRAALIVDGRIVEARIERDTPLRAGAVVRGRLAKMLVKGRRGLVETGAGEALLEPLGGLAEGASALFRVVREAIPEAGRPRLPRVAVAPDATAEMPAPSLEDRLRGPGQSVRSRPDAGALEAAGWSELIEEARTGEIGFAGGRLRISPTPAMLLIDVDGDGDPADLMIAGARAAAEAVRRFDVGGSIGVDLPTVAGKTARQAAAAAIDAALPQPFERTAVNGFGFLQIVRPRHRPSIVEQVRGDAAGSAAREALRRAGRADGAGPVTLALAPAVDAMLAARPDWIDALARQLGAPVILQGEAGRSIWSIDVHRSPIR
jgi:hypothetical protein